jgi:hypothetical protein
MTASTMAPALRHFALEREVIIATDSSDCESAGVLSEHDDEGVLHPVAYHWTTYLLAECNNTLYSMQQITNIKALEKWRPKCDGAKYPWQLITDHKNLECFIPKNLLNWGQAQWSRMLTGFDYEIVYHPEKSNGKLDALIRRPGDLPEGENKGFINMELVVLKPHNLPELQWKLAIGVLTREHPLLVDLFSQVYQADPLPDIILKTIRENSS